MRYCLGYMRYCYCLGYIRYCYCLEYIRYCYCLEYPIAVNHSVPRRHRLSICLGYHVLSTYVCTRVS